MRDSKSPGQFAGVAAGLISALSYGAMSYVVHAQGLKLPATEVIFCRSAFALLALAPFAWRDRSNLMKRGSGSLWLRSFCAAVSILCFTWNLQHTSIGLANVLFGIAPLGVLFFAWWSHAEKLTVLKVICLALVVAGSCVFYGDSAHGVTRTVLIVGIGGALAAAASYTALKKASGWSPMTLTWALSLLSIPVTLALKRGPWVSLHQGVWQPLLAIAMLCTLAQITVALSYRWAEVSTATAVASSSLVWGVALDVWLGSSSGVSQLIGCGIYLAGCIPLTVMKEKITGIPSRVPFAGASLETANVETET